MTKILCYGDPHLDCGTPEAVSTLLERTVILLDELKPDFVVILGDVCHYHERIYTLTLNKAYEFIEIISNKVPLFVLVGNHDYINNQQYLTENHWMNSLKKWDRVTIVDKVCEYHHNDNYFVFCPYVPNKRFEDALNTLSPNESSESSEKWKKADIIFAHQEIYGAKMAAIISVEGDKWETDYPTLISGHLHDTQKPQENVYYPGSTLQSGYGDSPNKSIALITTPLKNTPLCDEPQSVKVGKNVMIKKIKLGIPLKKTVYHNVDSINDWEIPTNTKDHYRVSLKGDNYSEFKAFKKSKKYKELTQLGIKVVFKQTIPQRDEKDKVEVINDECEDKSHYFHKVLHKLVKDEGCPRLEKAYNKLVVLS